MNSPETENKQKAIGDLKKTLQIVSYRLKQYRRKYRVQTVVSVFLLLALVTSLMQDLYTQAAPPAASYSEV
ncbi:MAG: hypothetical protein Q8Q20_02220, partial [bacterium]|nr:hypothetical protein [bacterium]